MCISMYGDGHHGRPLHNFLEDHQNGRVCLANCHNNHVASRKGSCLQLFGFVSCQHVYVYQGWPSIMSPMYMYMYLLCVYLVPYIYTYIHTHTYMQFIVELMFLLLCCHSNGQHFITLAHVGGGYSTLCVCVRVCLLPQNNVKIAV